MEKSNRKLHLLGDEKKLRDLSENKFRKKQKIGNFVSSQAKKRKKTITFLNSVLKQKKFCTYC